eukprot:239469-Pleurochrysis_carterae.AAC.2
MPMMIACDEPCTKGGEGGCSGSGCEQAREDKQKWERGELHIEELGRSVNVGLKGNRETGTERAEVAESEKGAELKDFEVGRTPGVHDHSTAAERACDCRLRGFAIST